MTWLLLLSAGLALMALPSPRAGRGSCSYRSLQTMDFERRTAGWGRVAFAALRVPALWIDLARGAAGSFLFVWGTEAERLPAAFPASLAPALQVALVVLAATASMLASILRFNKTHQAPAPLAFVTGLALGLCPAPVCGIAVAAALVLAFALKSLDAFFWALATVLLVLGLLIQHQLALVLVAAGLTLVPPLAAIVGGRQLTIPFRRWPEF